MNTEGAKKAAYCPRTRHSPKSPARSLASPFILPAASSYYEVLTVVQLHKADATCVEADAAACGWSGGRGGAMR
jgi:hypothetical protein